MTSAEDHLATDHLDVPEAPPLDADDAISAFAAAATTHWKSWAAAYEECRTAGMKREKLMRAAADALSTPDTTQQERIKDDKLAVFDTAYRTQRVGHSDTYTKLGWALRTTWRAATDSTSYYENTPQPSAGRILSWQNQRCSAREPLRNSDIYYFQYYRASTTHPLPPLRYVRRQQAYARTTQPVYDYLRYLHDPAGDGALPAAVYPAGTAKYYALLGTMNGTAPAFLVIDWARELGVAGISAIELDAALNMYFHFSPAEPESGATASSSSSSSPSSSSSSSSSSS
ncbi:MULTISPECIES: hypothetical protein [unclassified Nocardia]|uniref:hypothetical protein n=1 Tax=unclassified Nocardia TaxID=2637762 RepID=UPI00278C71F1|nr:MULTISPECIES: hypothetical protein [unclassified Nocardia]